MHIAICNNLIADRKQLERLLKRESDSRNHSAEILYVDSYGNREAFLASVLMYDIVMIDMSEGPDEIFSLSQALRKAGSTALIALCNISSLAKESLDLISPWILMEKPIKPEAITSLVDKGLSIRSLIKTPLEIRGDNQTFYLQEAEILYISPRKEYSDIHKKDGTCISFLCKIDDLIFTLEDQPAFYLNKTNCIINVNYIEKINTTSIVLTDKTVLPISFLDQHYLRGQILQQKKATQVADAGNPDLNP